MRKRSILLRLVNNMDLVTTLAEVMVQMQVYTSLSSLSMVNREYNELLGPFMKRTRERIVIDLSDLHGLSQERYKDIEYVSLPLHLESCLRVLKLSLISRSVRIIECTSGSRVLNDSKEMNVARALSRKAAGFRPWLLTFRGDPKKYLFDVQSRHLPTIDVVRVINDERQITLEGFDECDHCAEIGCADGGHGAVFEHYSDTFFVHDQEESQRNNPEQGTTAQDAPQQDLAHYASTFRYYASHLRPSTKSHKDHIFYMMDMKSITGKKWEYRREEDVSIAKMGDLLYDQLSYDDYGSHGVSRPLYLAIS
jgi:hypothetical protein